MFDFSHTIAPETLRSYMCAWRLYVAWCEEWGNDKNEESLIAYLSYKMGLPKPLTHTNAARIIAACKHNGVRCGRKTKLAIRAIARQNAHKPPVKKLPITLPMLAKITGPPQNALEHRDRAILLVGFWGAFRRSELCALEARDVSFKDKGVLIRLKKSKTDQEGKGMTKAILRMPGPGCPVDALADYLRGRREGPLFLSRTGKKLNGANISAAVKRALARAGYDADGYGGHSLRAGFVTAALSQGAPFHEVMRQTGHKKAETLMLYYRQANPWADNAMARFGAPRPSSRPPPRS